MNQKKTCYIEGGAIITGNYTSQNSIQTTKRFNKKMEDAKSEQSKLGHEAYYKNVITKNKLKKKSL